MTRQPRDGPVVAAKAATTAHCAIAAPTPTLSTCVVPANSTSLPRRETNVDAKHRARVLRAGARGGGMQRSLKARTMHQHDDIQGDVRMRARSQRHHEVPEWLLKHFCWDPGKMLWIGFTEYPRSQTGQRQRCVRSKRYEHENRLSESGGWHVSAGEVRPRRDSSCTFRWSDISRCP